MPTDHFAGLLDGPNGAGGGPAGTWFDGDDTTWGIMAASASYVIDALSAVPVDRFRVAWHYGELPGGSGAAGPFAIYTGTSAAGPWTAVVTEPDAPTTAGVTYPENFELEYDLGTTTTSRYWRIHSTSGGRE